MGAAVIRSKNRPTVNQDGFDTLNGKRGVQEGGAGAVVVVASAPKRIKQAEVVRDKVEFSPAKDIAATASKPFRTLWYMCKGWLFRVRPLLNFILNMLGQGSEHLAPTMMQSTSVLILSVFSVFSVFSVVLCWTDIKFAFGQTDYGSCKVLVDRVAGKTSSNSFMVAMTLLTTMIFGAVGFAFIRWIHFRRQMKVIDEVLKTVPLRMVRDDPDMELRPAIERYSGME